MSAVTLETASLFSKYGFSDGDLLWDLFADDAVVSVIFGATSIAHEALCVLVQERLLPALDPPVMTRTIVTIHNPIRADSFDDDPVTPASVTVPTWDVFCTVRRVIADHATRNPEFAAAFSGALADIYARAYPGTVR